MAEYPTKSGPADYALVVDGQILTEPRLQKAHEAQYHKALVDIISMVKHAARE